MPLKALERVSGDILGPLWVNAVHYIFSPVQLRSPGTSLMKDINQPVKNQRLKNRSKVKPNLMFLPQHL